MKQVINLLTLSLALTLKVQAQRAACFGDEQFVFFNDPIPQADAKAACIELNGTLGRVGNAAEVQVFQGVMVNVVEAWVGIEDPTNTESEDTGRFVFVDGNTADLPFIHVAKGVAPWVSNAPKINGGACVTVISFGGNVNTLTNQVCEVARPYVCRNQCPPTAQPTTSPTAEPTISPTKFPTSSPTKNPTKNPTSSPTKNPTKNPTTTPTKNPTTNPTTSPTKKPTSSPTKNPTSAPTTSPTKNPTANPTTSPTKKPTSSPTKNPTKNPTESPTTSVPTTSPTKNPTKNPTISPTLNPTKNPTSIPTLSPTQNPTTTPTFNPTRSPVPPTFRPTEAPTQTAAGLDTVYIVIIGCFGVIVIALSGFGLASCLSPKPTPPAPSQPVATGGCH